MGAYTQRLGDSTDAQRQATDAMALKFWGMAVGVGVLGIFAWSWWAERGRRRR